MQNRLIENKVILFYELNCSYCIEVYDPEEWRDIQDFSAHHDLEVPLYNLILPLQKILDHVTPVDAFPVECLPEQAERFGTIALKQRIQNAIRNHECSTYCFYY